MAILNRKRELGKRVSEIQEEGRKADLHIYIRVPVFVLTDRHGSSAIVGYGAIHEEIPGVHDRRRTHFLLAPYYLPHRGSNAWEG